MKLLDSLYTITSETSIDASTHSFSVRLEPEHFIYKAHFPGEPITPGVCILQIALELLQRKLSVPLQTDTVKNVKFLRVITPDETPEVVYTLQKITVEEPVVKCQITVAAENEVYAKLSLICRMSE